MMLNRDMRSFQIFLIDNIINSFTFMTTNLITWFSILKLFIMLYRKVLSLDVFLIFFGFDVADGAAVKAILDVSWVNWFLSGDDTTFLIKAVLEFVTQVKIGSVLVNVFHLFWVLIVFLALEIMLIVGLISVNDLMFRSTFFGSESKSNG
jgi:hypothetical protein